MGGTATKWLDYKVGGSFVRSLVVVIIECRGDNI